MSKITEYTKNKRNFQKIKLLSGRSIGITHWLVKEEKELLFNVEMQPDNKELLINESINLIKNCVDKKQMIDKLSKNDIIFILVQLRKISNSKQVDFKFTCQNTKCPSFITFSPEKQQETGVTGRGTEEIVDNVDLKEDIVSSPFKSDNIAIGNIVFTPKELSYKTQRELETLYINEDKLQLNKFNYNVILNSIASVTIGDDKMSDFSKGELSDFIDNNLKMEDFKRLSEQLNEQMSTFKIEKKVSCPVCKNETKVVYDELFSLFLF